MHRSGSFSVSRYEDDDEIEDDYDNITASLKVESRLKSSKKFPTSKVCLKFSFNKKKELSLENLVNKSSVFKF